MPQPAQAIFYHCLRLVLRIALACCYRVRSRPGDAVPDGGPALLVANHVSLVDALVIGTTCRRRIRFVMDHRIYRTPGLTWLFRGIGAIPIASARSNRALMERAFSTIDAALAAGEVVCLFPEGRLCRDGRLETFRPGVERILRGQPVPVIPLAIGGLWGSRFSYCGGLLKGSLRRGRRRVDVVYGDRVEAARVTADRLRAAVMALKAPLGA